MVVLTGLQAEVGRLHALRVEQASTGLRNRGGSKGLTPEQSLAQREDASCGELAASLMTGIAWNMGINEFGKADLGTSVDVKTRPDKQDKRGRPYGLRFAPGCDPDLFYLLVLSLERCHRYELAGGMWGREILAHPDFGSWKSNPYGKGAVHWVPRDVLYIPDWSLI